MVGSRFLTKRKQITSIFFDLPKFKRENTDDLFELIMFLLELVVFKEAHHTLDLLFEPVVDTLLSLTPYCLDRSVTFSLAFSLTRISVLTSRDSPAIHSFCSQCKDILLELLLSLRGLGQYLKRRNWSKTLS